jgi:hypothetical protein
VSAPTLWDDHAYPGRTDTSRAAAERVLPKTGTQRRRVYDALLDASQWVDGGLTDDELVARLKLPANSIRPRRGELVEAGLVIDSGVRVLNDYGNMCIVWRAVP